MQWALGLVATSVYYIITGAYFAKYMPSTQKTWAVFLGLLPILYLLNVFYFRCVQGATLKGVPILVVVIVAISSETVLGFLMGWLYLHQKVSELQWTGIILVLIGVILTNFPSR